MIEGQGRGDAGWPWGQRSLAGCCRLPVCFGSRPGLGDAWGQPSRAGPLDTVAKELGSHLLQVVGSPCEGRGRSAVTPKALACAPWGLPSDLPRQSSGEAPSHRVSGGSIDQPPGCKGQQGSDFGPTDSPQLLFLGGGCWGPMWILHNQYNLGQPPHEPHT